MGQHRRAHSDPGDLRLVLPLELARVVRTSVDVLPMSKPITRSKPAAAAVRAMPTMPQAGPDRMESLPRKARRVGQPAVGLHEQQPDAVELGRHLVTYRPSTGER